jgi:hypothetical protein
VCLGVGGGGHRLTCTTDAHVQIWLRSGLLPVLLDLIDWQLGEHANAPSTLILQEVMKCVALVIKHDPSAVVDMPLSNWIQRLQYERDSIEVVSFSFIDVSRLCISLLN